MISLISRDKFRLKLIDICSAILAVAIGWISYYESNIFAKPLYDEYGLLIKHKNQNNALTTLLRCIAMVLTIILDGTIIRRY